MRIYYQHNVLSIDSKQGYDTYDTKNSTISGNGKSKKKWKINKADKNDITAKSENTVVKQGTPSRLFEVKNGLRQGNPLSSILFNITTMLSLCRRYSAGDKN